MSTSTHTEKNRLPSKRRLMLTIAAVLGIVASVLGLLLISLRPPQTDNYCRRSSLPPSLREAESVSFEQEGYPPTRTCIYRTEAGGTVRRANKAWVPFLGSITVLAGSSVLLYVLVTRRDATSPH